MHPRRTRGVRRASAAGVAIVLTAGLVGCSDDDDAAADPPPESTSTATDEAGGDGTEAAEPVPELPPEAQGDDDAAAVAFVEHWVELVNYAIATGDGGPARRFYAPSCEVCEAAIGEIEETAGDDSSGSGTWSLSDASPRDAAPEDPQAVATVVTSDVSISGSTPDPYGWTELGLDFTPEAGWQIAWMLSYAY
ncbi:DUF6318 family protein [Nocardioides zeae]|uniref:DUF6318 family protein n=1 Tax=Nocardioides imazamoxiresistens TaxID=3231893 RepID=A0ABU3PWR4_9ACTN|nr:DUF6318 family protein [Nocardioides zeae]MDT9593680.1 DUF6318 family protein [Nocardioides zeae]